MGRNFFSCCAAHFPLDLKSKEELTAVLQDLLYVSHIEVLPAALVVCIHAKIFVELKKLVFCGSLYVTHSVGATERSHLNAISAGNLLERNHTWLLRAWV